MASKNAGIPGFVGAMEVRISGIATVEQEATLNALAVEAFNDLLKKHGKRQSVENPLLD